MAQREGTAVKNLPWVEKYRPSTLDDVMSQKEIITAITKLINEDRLPHMLFHGPPGTGKTSTILAASKLMYTRKQLPSMVLELNASDDRGIGVVREQVMNFAQTRTLHFDESSRSKIKLIILDEADSMTKDAQNALRRIMERFTENVRFCIICNYLSKIIPPIQSRCTRFRFAPLKEELIIPRLRFIAESENVNLTEDGEKAVVKLAEGDLRRVINMFQSTAMAFPCVNEKNLHQCVGQPAPSEVDKILRILLNSSFQDAFHQIEKIKQKGAFALSDILLAMHDMVYQLDIPPEVACLLMSRMSEIEFHLSEGCSDRLQLAALISAFIDARAEIKTIAIKSSV